MTENKRTKTETLAYLQQKIQKIEGFKENFDGDQRYLGIEGLDNALPRNSFPLSAVHEFVCDDLTQAAPTFGFMAGLIATIKNKSAPVLWISKRRDIFPQGLLSFGLDPQRIIFVYVYRDCEVLWAMEEGLRTKGIAVSIAEVADADFNITRRLQLAVEQSGVTGFLMRVNPKHSSASSCFSSWKITSLPSGFDDALPGVGFPRWNVELRKIRHGRPGSWQIEWKGGSFHLVKPKSVQTAPRPLYASAS